MWNHIVASALGNAAASRPSSAKWSCNLVHASANAAGVVL
jgi:hypothetical protein